jgi:tetratricopeptide (TPR) repeat protein
MTAYMAKSMYLTNSHRPSEGRRVADAGLLINPNFATLYAVRSNADIYLGQFEQAKSDIQQAMLLSPRDPRSGQWHNFMADAELGLGHYDRAIEQASMAIDAGYRIYFSCLNLAAAHAFKGEMDEAKTALAEARHLYPKLSVKWLSVRKPILQPAFEVLRKAGLPEEWIQFRLVTLLRDWQLSTHLSRSPQSSWRADNPGETRFHAVTLEDLALAGHAQHVEAAVFVKVADIEGSDLRAAESDLQADGENGAVAQAGERGGNSGECVEWGELAGAVGRNGEGGVGQGAFRHSYCTSGSLSSFFPSVCAMLRKPRAS